MVKSSIQALRRLSDVNHRQDMRDTAAQARKLVLHLEQLIKAQTFPAGEVILLQVSLPKSPPRVWRAPLRLEAFQTLLREQIVPKFKSADVESSGQIRYTVVLSCSRG
jgi:hypothetical protein